jgi:imidazolonepropionase-like amidohydrolase
VVFALAAVWSAGARAEEPSPAIVLRAAHWFDASSGRLLDGAAVLVQGEKITAVDARQPPSGARVIDLGDATLLPGLIDAHTHLTTEMQKDFYRGFHTEMFRFSTEQAHYAAVYALRTLEAGFTTVRDVGASEFVDVGLRNAIAANIVPGPRMLTAVHAIGSTGGHCDAGPFPPDRVVPPGVAQGVCNGPEECRAAVRHQLKYGADVIKICASGGVLSEADPVDVPQLTAAELSAIVSEAKAWKRKVAAHAHGDLAARLAVEAGVDSIEHGSFLSEDTLRRMKAKGTYLVPTRLAVYTVNQQASSFPPAIAAKARAAWQAHEKMFRAALKIGVPIAFGTDSGVSAHGLNATELVLLTELGMTPAAALLSATRDAARLLGVDAEVGTLAPGKLADVVAVKGNVLANIASAQRPIFVMKHGKVIRSP